jgi:Flp pilus assembly protein TadG
MFETASRFLQRLRSDKRGNTLAIMAAAFLPLVGLIGGGVDMSRIYITKTRLQQACDAGALAGRKAMGSGSWTTSGANNTRSQAYQLFTSNFKTGNFGTGPLTRNFVESDGTVTGTASTTVPMTLMQIFGYSDHNVSVTCTAEMEIPNTDVMFVLDLTASMNCAPGSAASCYALTPQANAKVSGLHSAVKCFYEALLKVNTPEPCSVAPATDPTATSYDGTAQIRLGFVPYAVNVNVGKLLPYSHIADEWTYPSREANTATVHTWTVGAENPISWGGWPSAPALNNASGYSSWTDISTSGGATTTINGVARTKRPKTGTGTELSSTACLALNTLTGSSQTMVDYTNAGSVQAATPNGTPLAPTHPAATQTVNYQQNDNHTVRGYRYRYNNVTTDDCRLQQSANRLYTLTRDGSATRPVTWTDYEEWTSWDYEPRTFTVSGLKAGNPNWSGGSVSIPNVTTTSVSGLRRSGQNATTTTSITIPANETGVTWGGCILERTTWQNTDGDPSDEWDPIPSQALDMIIDHIPSGPTAASAWGPLLPNTYYGRQSGSSRTTSSPITTTTLNPGWERGDYYCPAAARKLAPYNAVGDLVTYIDGFQALGIGTYHDIGLLWGARLLSPTGIFASENALTEDGGAIERHLIFMTDGNSQTFVDNLDAHGLPWWNRKQTLNEPTSTVLNGTVNARLTALCTAIKNMNIELWVISYGGAVDATNEARLTACASPGRFFSAASTPTLIANFKQIASEIADLRLTE